MAVPPHRRKRSPFARQVLGVRLRKEAAPSGALNEHQRYILGQAHAGNVKWSHRGGRWHWRCDDTDVSATVARLVVARLLEVSGTPKSRQRTMVVTEAGMKELGSPPASEVA